MSFLLPISSTAHLIGGSMASPDGHASPVNGSKPIKVRSVRFERVSKGTESRVTDGLMARIHGMKVTNWIQIAINVYGRIVSRSMAYISHTNAVGISLKIP